MRDSYNKEVLIYVPILFRFLFIRSGYSNKEIRFGFVYSRQEYINTEQEKDNAQKWDMDDLKEQLEEKENIDKNVINTYNQTYINE